MKDSKGHGSNPKGVHAGQIDRLPTKKAMAETVTSRELKVFGDNDANLYRQSQQPIEANLSKKIAAGTYNHDLATKLWGYHADRAAQAYHKQFGSRDTQWHQMFSTSDRRAAAVQWANRFRAEHVAQAPRSYPSHWATGEKMKK